MEGKGRASKEYKEAHQRRAVRSIFLKEVMSVRTRDQNGLDEGWGAADRDHGQFRDLHTDVRGYSLELREECK